MIQQKKINANFSLNDLNSINFPKRFGKKLSKHNQAKSSKKNSLIHILNEDQHENNSLNINKSIEQKSLKQLKYSSNLGNKKNDHMKSQNQKRRSIQINKNLHSSVVNLSQIQQNYGNKKNLKQRRLSLNKPLEIKNKCIDNQKRTKQRVSSALTNYNQKDKQITNPKLDKSYSQLNKKSHSQIKKKSHSQLKKKSQGQVPNHKYQQTISNSKLNIRQANIYQSNNRQTNIEPNLKIRKNNISCKSIIEQRRKSSSQGKQKQSKSKNKSKKQSFKFNNINIQIKKTNKQNNKQNILNKQNQQNIINKPIEKGIKKIINKVDQLIKNNKDYQQLNNNKDYLQLNQSTKQKKKNSLNRKQTQKKLSQKQSINKVKRQISFTKQPNYLVHHKASKSLIQNPHCQQQFSLKLKPPLKQPKNKVPPRQQFFLIRKDQTPSSSIKEFPINKYFLNNNTYRQIDIIEERQKNKFDKTLKTNKRILSGNQTHSYRSNSPNSSYLQSVKFHQIKQQYLQKNIKTKQKHIKTKAKQQKKKYQTHSSCLNLWAEQISSSINQNDNQSQITDIIYQSSSKQSYKQAQYKLSEKNISQNRRQLSQNTFFNDSPQPYNKSLNIDEIRYYEGLTPQNQPMPQQKNKFVKIFHKKCAIRSKIMFQLEEQYPLLTKKQLQFLASIYLIQRKWRQKVVSKKIKNLISFNNTTKLFVKKQYNPANTLDNEKFSSNLIDIHNKSLTKNLTTQSHNTQTQQCLSQQVPLQDQKIQALKRQQIKQNHIIQQNDQKLVLLKQQDIFPDVSYIKTIKQLQKKRFLEQNYRLSTLMKNDKITIQQFQNKKNSLQIKYKKSLQSILLVKNSLKKGYLRYVQSINHVRNHFANTNQYKILRRVSSQQGIMSQIYKKIFKIDQLSDNLSQASNDTKKLTDMLLIRKLNDQPKIILNSKANNHINKLKQTTKNGKCISLELQSCVSLQLEVSSQRSYEKRQNQPLYKGLYSQRQVSQCPSLPSLPRKILNISHLLSIDQNDLNESQKIVKSQELSNDKYLVNYLEQEIEQFQKDILDQDKQPIDLNQFEDQFFHKQFITQQQIDIYHSPITSRVFHNTASIQAEKFLIQFVSFVKQSNLWNQVYTNFNKSQGFEPKGYLRFLREFQLPTQCYIAIIPNEAFIAWQQQIINELDKNQSQKQWDQFSYSQLKIIQHRCLYQLLNCQLQKFRIYGQKGRPFPWQSSYSTYQISEIPQQKVQICFQKCIQDICKKYLTSCCGIILQNHPEIITQEDLEQLHDKNQDQIIQILQSGLLNQQNLWYELDQHILELKLQLGQLIWEEIITQLVVDLGQINAKSSRMH